MAIQFPCASCGQPIEIEVLRSTCKCRFADEGKRVVPQERLRPCEQIAGANPRIGETVNARLCGVIIEIDAASGRASSIERVCIPDTSSPGDDDGD